MLPPVADRPKLRATLDQLAALEGYARHLTTAPLGIVLVMDGKNEEFATYDEGRLAERIMLVAAAHGLGSCIGWWTNPAREEAKRLLGVHLPAGEHDVQRTSATDQPGLWHTSQRWPSGSAK